MYLGTDDPVFVRSVSEKVELLSMLRLISHFGSRLTPEHRDLCCRYIEAAQARLRELLPRVDTLVF